MDDVVELSLSASLHERVELTHSGAYIDETLEVSVGGLGSASATVSNPASTDKINTHL